jgi:hypothetical protein
MPDGTVQFISLLASEAGKQEFLRIAAENRMNISPVLLNQKNVHPGDVVSVSAQPVVSESTAYRFLANQFCAGCSVTKVISKAKGGFIFMENGSGAIEAIDFFWVPQLQRWGLSVIPSTELASEFTSTTGRPIYY